MQRRLGKRIFSFFPVVLLAFCFQTEAFAADTVLPIRVRIERCVTAEEQAAACDEKGLCCDFGIPGFAPETAAPDMVVLESHPNPENGSTLWMRTLSQRGSVPAVTNRL